MTIPEQSRCGEPGVNGLISLTKPEKCVAQHASGECLSLGVAKLFAQ